MLSFISVIVSLGIAFWIYKKSSNSLKLSTTAISNFMEMVRWSFAEERTNNQLERVKIERMEAEVICAVVEGEQNTLEAAKVISSISDQISELEKRSESYRKNAKERREEAFKSLGLMYKGDKNFEVIQPDETDMSIEYTHYRRPLLTSMIHKEVISGRMDQIAGINNLLEQNKILFDRQNIIAEAIDALRTDINKDEVTNDQ